MPTADTAPDATPKAAAAAPAPKESRPVTVENRDGYHVVVVDHLDGDGPQDVFKAGVDADRAREAAERIAAGYARQKHHAYTVS